ncbi:MAG: hypothetical protein ACRBN8_15765 [Nannocystales bacterium]
MVLLVACGSAGETGAETQGCEQGQCLGELVCLSDLCVDPQWEPEASTGASGPEPSGSSGPATSQSSTSGPSGGTETGDGQTGSASSGESVSCGAVDVLVLIDNSISMAAKQQRVEAALGPFFDALEVATGDNAHHVMIIDSDAWPFAECELTLCPVVGGCWPVWPEYVCGETTPMVCEDVLGAGVTHPRGVDAANTDCALGGQRFTRLSEDGARDRVACAARVGTSGGAERPMDALVAAVDPRTEAGVCNEGFARSERPLAIVLVTDEEDDPEDSMGTPAVWHERLTESRVGPVFVLGLVGDHIRAETACTTTSTESPSGAEPSPRLWQFIELFGSAGVLASVCAEDYAPALEAFAHTVGDSCGG